MNVQKEVKYLKRQNRKHRHILNSMFHLLTKVQVHCKDNEELMEVQQAYKKILMELDR